MSYAMIIVPEGAPLPEEFASLVRREEDIVKKISACAAENGPLHIVPVNTRELQLIVEYRDLFDLETKAVIGLQGAMYSTVWNTYVSTMNRVTLDNVRVMMKERNDTSAREGTVSIIHPTRAQRLARFETTQTVAEPDQSTDPFSEDGAP